MNALKTAIYRQVVSITGHNNLLQQTKDAIDFTTLELHTSANFKRDVSTHLVTFDSSDVCTDNMLSIPVDIIGKVRRIVEVTAIGLNPNDSTVVTLCNTYGQFVLSKSNITAVVVNSDIILKLSDRFMYTGITVSGTVLPDVSDDAYNSWIATDYPSVLVERCAYKILTDVGDATARGHNDVFSRAYAHLISDSGILPR